MAAPSSTGAPVITSNKTPNTAAYIGALLTSTVGTWSSNPLPYVDTFQWRKGGVDIEGATAATLLLAAEDFAVGDVITCNVTRTNDDGATDRLSGARTIITSVPVSTVAPTAVPSPGGPILSNTLYGVAGTWTGDPVPTLTYQWRKNGADISGATAISLALSAHAIGDSIVLRETANNSAGGPITRDSAAVVIMPDFHVPANTRLPQTHALDVNEVWDITLLGDTQVFIDGAFVGWTKPGTNTKSFRFAQAGTYTISTTNPVEKCVVTVT